MMLLPITIIVRKMRKREKRKNHVKGDQKKSNNNKIKKIWLLFLFI